MSNLRVITGKAKGHPLRMVPGNITRPITDRVKESLFNIIAADIQNATMLDMFAGTGSVGIEALSRGAQFVRFVDRHNAAIKTIRANLESTGLSDRADVLRRDAFAVLEQDVDRAFDYIYIAPPQYKEIWKRALKAIDAHLEWLREYAWVIVQIDPLEYEEMMLKNLREFEKRRYGSTLLVFYIIPP
ncbi:MAG: 16S rRNA (guanine(966)-N(2))-methyltransferase RsmD [Chloroflexota bacterium]|nr:16S rRNA (guanine(966)-N(2))-methyltransferase RsmD [Chloroflexota bacterium]